VEKSSNSLNWQGGRGQPNRSLNSKLRRLFHQINKKGNSASANEIFIEK